MALTSQLVTLQSTCNALSSHRSGDEDTMEAMADQLHDLRQDLAKAKAKSKTLDGKLNDANGEIEDLVAQNKEQSRQIKELKTARDEMHLHMFKV